ncbi:SRPBCC family protein [Kitasatospora azatica]|uniref:SRPBCC family protein n=1 Tax=Kitasatospora azatica TaxID=58347 RepID=UPI0005658776|nr:SRPBCC family protein [Kitasatospora azatica]
MPDFNHYHLVSSWRLPAPPAAVYHALREVEEYPRWWPQVRQVERLDDSSGRVRIRSVLPYELVLIARERRQDEAAGVLEAELTGDLAGWSRWTVSPDGPGASRAVFEEEVRPGKPLMRRLALPGRPLFLVNHALMMRAGERGLRRLLSSSNGP